VYKNYTRKKVMGNLLDRPITGKVTTEVASAVPSGSLLPSPLLPCPQ